MANDIVNLETQVYSEARYSVSTVIKMTGLPFSEIKRIYPVLFEKDAIAEEWCMGSKEVIPLIFIGASQGVQTAAYKALASSLLEEGFDINKYSLQDINEAGFDLAAQRRNLWSKLEALHKKEQRNHVESDFESKLVDFLVKNNIYYTQQLKRGASRFDVVIPGQLVIELKAGRATGDDACQALDYLAFQSLDVLLVGSGLSSSASRAIEAANKISRENKILFVTHQACFSYLKDVLH